MASVIAASSFATPLKGMLHTAGRLHLLWHCFTFLLAGLVILHGASSARRQGFLAIACIAFGCCLEVLEHVIYRTQGVEIADILADAVGVTVGWLFFRLYQRQASLFAEPDMHG
jgi:VanZ family protein